MKPNQANPTGNTDHRHFATAVRLTLPASQVPHTPLLHRLQVWYIWMPRTCNIDPKGDLSSHLQVWSPQTSMFALSADVEVRTCLWSQHRQGLARNFLTQVIARPRYHWPSSFFFSFFFLFFFFSFFHPRAASITARPRTIRQTLWAKRHRTQLVSKEDYKAYADA